MAAGLHGTEVADAFEIEEVYVLLMRLRREDAESLRGRVRPLVAYVRAIPEEYAEIIVQLIEHAVEVRLRV